jgi:hypothetical protein
VSCPTTHVYPYTQVEAHRVPVWPRISGPALRIIHKWPLNGPIDLAHDAARHVADLARMPPTARAPRPRADLTLDRNMMAVCLSTRDYFSWRRHCILDVIRGCEARVSLTASSFRTYVTLRVSIRSWGNGSGRLSLVRQIEPHHVEGFRRKVERVVVVGVRIHHVIEGRRRKWG